MRVLVVTQYFPPEIGAQQTRLHTFAKGLAELGHEVAVVCAVPNHPQGVVHQGFRGRVAFRRRVDGLDVWYVWVHTRPTKTTNSRITFYASFAAMATAFSMALARPDVVFASSPPLTVGLPGALSALWHRVPLILDVRDLWPDFPVAVGELRNPRLLRGVKRLERWLYGRAETITTTTRPFAEVIAKRTDNPGKIQLLPNGTTRLWIDGSALEVDRGPLGLRDDEFIWTFAGNLGPAQGLQAALGAADILGPGFRLLLLGNGPDRQQLEAQAATLSSASVSFHDQVSQPEALRYLRASDALLVSLASQPEFSDAVPSKLYDYCAVRRPVIVAANGEPRRLAEAAQAGLGVAAGDARALADAVRRLRDDPSLRDRLAEAGGSFGAENARDRQVERLDRLVRDSVGS